jgi:hypothetical protein
MVGPSRRRAVTTEQFRLGASPKARAAGAYLGPLRTAGLELIALALATALGSDPIEARSRGLLTLGTLAWRAQKAPAKIGLGGPAGRLIYWLVHTRQRVIPSLRPEQLGTVRRTPAPTWSWRGIYSKMMAGR